MIRQLWMTNVLYEQKIPEMSSLFFKNLVKIGEEYELRYPGTHIPEAMRDGPEVSYNLLVDDRPEIKFFKEILKNRLIELATAEGYLNPNELVFEVTTNFRKFEPNHFATPHCHRSVDYVAVLFLHVKHEKKPAKVYQTVAGSRVMLIDPIPMRCRFLNHDMLHQINPKTGTLLIHSSSIFHATELNISDEPLLALVSNIKVKDSIRKYEEL